jgi:hypothetical protein
MSLELAAQHLASRGRKGDTMLVHMAPQEVSGLQALARAHGGTLTVNPDTGLPEANFLKRMLPMLIGAGLMYATGGTAAPLIGGLSNSALIGLGVGGLETARTGSLSKGLMAGLGAYGGAGLTSGLMGAGAGAQTAAAQQAAMKAVPESALSAGATQPITGAVGQGIQAGAAPGVAAPGVSQYALGNGTMYGGGTGLTAGGSGFGFNPATAAPQTTTVMPELTRQGVLNQAAFDATKSFTPTGGMEQLKAGLGNLKALPVKDMAISGLAAMAPTMQADEAKPYAGGGPNPYEYDYDPNKQFYTRVPLGTRQRDILAPTTPMMAMGGPVEDMSYQNRMDTIMANGGQMFAAGGGISHLGDYSDGGRLLKGPGDGVSDSIPATIANKRPARLADGEFVVPARIVSELGNGSTEAGARKLYAMMDRIQKTRSKTTGKNRVAVNSRAEKLLPA